MDIISKKKYFDFLDKKGKDCINRSYKNIYLLKDVNKYPQTDSNSQIKFLITNIYKNKNITYLNYFMIMLTHFISFDLSFKLLDIIKNKNITDTEIMDFVDKITNKKKDTQHSFGEDCGKQLFGIEFLRKKINNKFTKYLDIGCGDGTKTVLFHKIFNININDVNGTDIKLWGPYHKNREFPFHFKFILSNEKLDYEDNSFDIITCFLTLHHIKDMDIMISEIYRLLKLNGIFILIEHDVLNYYDNLIIDIQHTFFAFLYDKNKKYIEKPYYSKYFNNMEFEYIFTNKHKFKLLSSGTYCQTIDMQKRYDSQFYQIYTTNKKI